MKNQSPIKVTICPPAFAAPCSATITPEAAAAIRAHNDALETRWQENSAQRRMPITYGKKESRGPLWLRHHHTPHEPPTDIMDELYG